MTGHAHVRGMTCLAHPAAEVILAFLVAGTADAHPRRPGWPCRWIRRHGAHRPAASSPGLIPHAHDEFDEAIYSARRPPSLVHGDDDRPRRCPAPLFVAPRGHRQRLQQPVRRGCPGAGIILGVIADTRPSAFRREQRQPSRPKTADPMQVAVYPLAAPLPAQPCRDRRPGHRLGRSQHPRGGRRRRQLLIAILALDVVVFRCAVQVRNHLDPSRDAGDREDIRLPARGCSPYSSCSTDLSDVGVIHLTGATASPLGRPALRTVTLRLTRVRVGCWGGLAYGG